MRTRLTGYDDYGFSEEEAKQLKEYCRNVEFDAHDLLVHAAVSTYPVLAGDLYYSITSGLSYDQLMKIKTIPLARGDFYGYQRKCLAKFRDLLIMHGKWCI